jgi:hypothetical protein
MELHGEMVCIIANYDSPESILGTASNVVVQSWVGAPRSFHVIIEPSLRGLLLTVL